MANKLDIANAQLTGFYHGKHYGSDIIGLIESMGLTKKEWLKIKSERIMTHILEKDMEEIDKHFGLRP